MRSTWIGGLVAVAVVGTACHKMTALSWNELDAMRPGQVWVTYSDETVAELSGPQRFGDTLVGYIGGAFTEIPTAQIKQVTMRESAKGKTIALVAASTAVAAGLAVWMAGAGEPSEKDMVDCNDVPDDPRCT